MFYSVVILPCKNGKWPLIRLNSLSIQFPSQWRVTGSYVFPKNAVFLVESSVLLGGSDRGLILVGGKVYFFSPQSTKINPGANPFSYSGCRVSTRGRATGVLLWPLTYLASLTDLSYKPTPLCSSTAHSRENFTFTRRQNCLSPSISQL